MEESEVTGVAVIKDKVGAQVSEMEVDDVGEDEVVVEDLKSKGGRKQAPSLPPKPSRKQTHASTAIGSKPTVIERTDSSASVVTACNRCRYHNIKCTPTDVGCSMLELQGKALQVLLHSREGKFGAKDLILGSASYEDCRWGTDKSFQTQGVANSLGRSMPLSPQENSSKHVRGFVTASTPSSGDWRHMTTSCGRSSMSRRLVQGP